MLVSKPIPWPPSLRVTRVSLDEGPTDPRASQMDLRLHDRDSGANSLGVMKPLEDPCSIADAALGLLETTH